MKNIYIYLIIVVLLTSCKTSQTVISIDSGGGRDNVKPNNVESPFSQNELTVSYSEDEKLVANPSNIINYTVYKKVKIPKVDVEPQKKTEKKTNEKAEDNFHLKKVKKEKKQKGKKEKTEKVKVERVKPKYAYANISQAFYKVNILNVVYDIIAIPMAIPTFGQSLFWINPVRQRDYFIAKKCKHDGLCNGFEHSINKKILIETDISVKNSVIKDSILIIDNLPTSFKLNTYKIVKKRGGSQIADIKHEIKTSEGKKYLQFTIVPKERGFYKDCGVWIKLDVTIVPTKKDFAINENNN